MLIETPTEKKEYSHLSATLPNYAFMEWVPLFLRLCLAFSFGSLQIVDNAHKNPTLYMPQLEHPKKKREKTVAKILIG